MKTDKILFSLEAFGSVAFKIFVAILIFRPIHMFGDENSMQLDTGWVMKTGDKP